MAIYKFVYWFNNSHITHIIPSSWEVHRKESWDGDSLCKTHMTCQWCMAIHRSQRSGYPTCKECFIQDDCFCCGGSGQSRHRCPGIPQFQHLLHHPGIRCPSRRGETFCCSLNKAASSSVSFLTRAASSCTLVSLGMAAGCQSWVTLTWGTSSGLMSSTAMLHSSAWARLCWSPFCDASTTSSLLADFSTASRVAGISHISCS